MHVSDETFYFNKWGLSLQERASVRRVTEVVSRIKFKPEWEIAARFVDDRLCVYVILETDDVCDPTRKVYVQKIVGIGLEASEREILTAAWDAITFVAMHELSEHFYYGDSKPFCDHSQFDRS